MHPQETASLRPRPETAETRGLRVELPPAAATVPGPLPGRRGLTVGEETPVDLHLERPLDHRGSIEIWLRNPQAILNGPAVEAQGRRFLVAGPFTMGIFWYSGYAELHFKIDDRPGALQVQLPGVPGPQWLHWLWSWDAEAGIFQGYLDGTPVRLPGYTIDPWEMEPVETVALGVSDWAIGDVTFFDGPFAPAEALDRVPVLYRNAFDALMGAKEWGRLDVEPLRGETVYENPLATEADLADWRLEGPGEVRPVEGWARMRSTTPDAPGKEGHVVWWAPAEAPADFLLEFDCRVLEYGLCIVFFCAQGRNGEDIFDPALAERTGIFGHYTMGDIDCYHISYYASAPANPGRATSNMRKNHGFYLVDNGPAGIAPDSREAHRVALLKRGGRVELAVDGRCVIRHLDTGERYGPVLGAGRVGLRQMKWTVAEYRNLRVSAVRDA